MSGSETPGQRHRYRRSRPTGDHDHASTAPHAADHQARDVALEWLQAQADADRTAGREPAGAERPPRKLRWGTDGITRTVKTASRPTIRQHPRPPPASPPASRCRRPRPDHLPLLDTACSPPPGPHHPRESERPFGPTSGRITRRATDTHRRYATTSGGPGRSTCSRANRRLRAAATAPAASTPPPTAVHTAPPARPLPYAGPYRDGSRPGPAPHHRTADPPRSHRIGAFLVPAFRSLSQRLAEKPATRPHRCRQALVSGCEKAAVLSARGTGRRSAPAPRARAPRARTAG